LSLASVVPSLFGLFQVAEAGPGCPEHQLAK